MIESAKEITRREFMATARGMLEQQSRERSQKPYPPICPLCGGFYLGWFTTYGQRTNLTGEYSEHYIISVEYVHDDGSVCSRLKGG